MHALIRGKGIRVSSGIGSSKILTHKRAAHIEAHFLRTLIFFCRLVLGGGSGWREREEGGGLFVKITKLKNVLIHKRAVCIRPR